MNIGILKEDFNKESRVALTPAGVRTLVEAENVVYFEKGAGTKCRFSDEDYEEAGAKIVYSAEEVIGRSDIILKVYPISENEIKLIEDSKIVFSFMHLEVSGRKKMDLFHEKKITAIGYELVEDKNGNLPIQEVSSEIAGRLAIPIAQRCLEISMDGRGILLSGIPGVAPAAVVILGAGVVGRAAIKAALGVGAHVSVLDTEIHRLRKINDMFLQNITTVVANQYNIERGIRYADVLIAAIHMRGLPSPHLISENMVKTMKKGAVIIDISIDQGGAVETSRPTTLSDPTFSKHGVIHYCVPNIPSNVARTATYGLTNAVVPLVLAVSKFGIQTAMEKMPGLQKGICTLNGKCVKDSLKLLYNL